MARYKDVNYHQSKFIPINFSSQILPGSFEYTLNHLIENELDLTLFDKRYNNLMICDEMTLIGREMFSIDDCKVPSPYPHLSCREKALQWRTLG